MKVIDKFNDEMSEHPDLQIQPKEEQRQLNLGDESRFPRDNKQLVINHIDQYGWVTGMFSAQWYVSFT